MRWQSFLTRLRSSFARRASAARRRTASRRPAFETLEDRFVPSYAVTDLGVTAGFALSDARAMNQAGDVVGNETTSDLTTAHAFFGHNGVMTDLGTLGGANSYAWAINDADQVVGQADTGAVDANGNAIHHAFLWQNGVMTDLGTLGGLYSTATGINNAGQVVGPADTGTVDADGNAIYDTFQWQNSTLTDLGIASPFFAGINNAGQVAGTMYDYLGTLSAFEWQAGTTTLLARNFDLNAGYALPASADFINDSGAVAGIAVNDFVTGVVTDDCGNILYYEYYEVTQAAEWQPDGTLTNLGLGNFAAASASGVNASGQVVGAGDTGTVDANNVIIFHATLWQNGTLIDLTNEVPTSWTSSVASAINDAGQIAGTADNQAVLLTPVPVPGVSINDVSVTEGNSGTVNANFTVTLSFASLDTVTVQYATADGTATAGSDYTAASGTLTFAPGETSKTITVGVLGDRLAESNETFNVNLSAATNATIDDSQGVGTILDDEPRLSINDVTKAEGNSRTTSFVFTVSLSAAYDQTVTVRYATADGTAKASDRDYQRKSGTLTFAAGQTSQTITITVFGDRKKEPDETFYVNLSSPSSNALIADSQGVGTILNDDGTAVATKTVAAEHVFAAHLDWLAGDFMRALGDDGHDSAHQHY